MAKPDPELDRRVVGSKCEQDLNKNAAPQRNGILSLFLYDPAIARQYPDFKRDGSVDGKGLV